MKPLKTRRFYIKTNPSLSGFAAAISTTTATEHWKSDEIPVASLTAGKYFVVPLPMSGTLSTYERDRKSVV